MSLPWSDLHFLRPLWLTALLLLPLIIVLWRRLQRKRDPWNAVVDPHLLAALREPGSSQRKGGPLLLVLLAFTLCVTALAGPAWQRMQQPLLQSESALIIALDLSDRSRASDLSPTRLARAKFKIADLLNERGDGQFALVAYAGDAFTVAPLTDDGNTLASLLTALDQDTLPEQGQRADRAIRLAARLLTDAGFSNGQLLLVTDSVQSRDVEAAAEALSAGLRTSVLGVGTSAGAPIALREGGFLRDAGGDVLLPKLDIDALRRLAAAGGGSYRTITTDDSDLRRLGVLNPADAGSAVRESDTESTRFRDEGFWLILILLPLVALLFRRGWVLCLPLVLLATPQPATAFELESLWQRDDQRAWDALANDRAEQARALAKDPALRASAAYRQGDFEDAARHFAEGEQADDNYNRGNALARAGRLQEALAAYDQALQQQPSMEDASANREEVLKAIEQQKEQQQQDSKDQSEQDKDQGNQDPQNESGDEQSENGEDGSETEDGEDGEQQSELGDGEPGQPNGDGDQQPPSDEAGDAPNPEEGAEPTEQESQAFSDAMEQALNEQEQAEQAEQAEAGEAGEEGEGTRPLPSAEEVEAMEQKQKMEQLLRRVPDDPGGLLRRKFALEARRRQLEGRNDE